MSTPSFSGSKFLWSLNFVNSFESISMRSPRAAHEMTSYHSLKVSLEDVMIFTSFVRVSNLFFASFLKLQLMLGVRAQFNKRWKETIRTQISSVIF